MSLTTKEYRRILELIEWLYTDADAAVKFHAFCEALQPLVPFKSAAYAPAPPNQGSPLVFPGAIVYQAPMRPLYLFAQYYYRFHPYFQAVKHNGLEQYVNKAITLSELMPAARLDKVEYSDFLSLADVRYEICVSLRSQGDAVGLLGFHREKGSRDFNKHELHIMGLLMPHIARAFHLSGLASRTLAPSTAELIVGSRGELIALNREAKRIMKGMPPASFPLPELSDGATFVSTHSGVYRVRTAKDYRETSVHVQLDPDPSPLTVLNRLDGFGLTKRQREVAMGAVRGLSNREIADELCISEQTVKDHLYDIFSVMHIRKRSELAAKVLIPGALEKNS